MAAKGRQRTVSYWRDPATSRRSPWSENQSLQTAIRSFEGEPLHSWNHAKPHPLIASEQKEPAMFVITGATGHVGSVVVDTLLAQKQTSWD